MPRPKRQNKKAFAGPHADRVDSIEHAADAELDALDVETQDDRDDAGYRIEYDELPGAVAEPVQRAFDFDERVRLAPERPGCYLMFDRQGVICYVGKAANLRARLRQYATGQDNRFFVHLLHKVLGDIELVITASEKEALLLENELIKKHLPRFNVRLKDDKRFLHLKLRTDENFPRLQVVRRPANDGAQYFGPYAAAASARATLAQVNRHFQLRTCHDTTFRNRTRPCLEYQIHRCPGPCVLPVDVADYAAHVRDVSLFLSGRRGELLGRLKKRMGEAVDSEQFELAGRYRDQLKAIESSLEQQNVVLAPQRKSIDAIGLYREGARVAVAVLTFREGVLLGSQGYVLKDQEWPDAEVAEGFAMQLYDRGQAVPDELLLPVEMEGTETLAEWLTDLRKARAALSAEPVSRAHVVVTQPQRGVKARLTEMADENAKQHFAERIRTAATAQITLEGLQKRLHLMRLPRRIECYDISNISGTDAVGSMVVVLDGEAANREYRTFSVKTLDTPNDFAMMYEVLSRRFQKVIDGTSPAPDLVVIDGGKGQLKMAEQVLADLGVHGIDLCGLAKARTLDSDDKGKSKSSPERVFRPGQKNPIVMPQNSNEVYLLTRIRDEAHRFAITFHRKKRQIRQLKSKLDGVPGVGAVRKKALLQVFGSLKGVTEADEAALAAVPGVGGETARRIKLVLRLAR